MKTLTMTNHAAVRMAQRGIASKDAELIVMIGTEVEGGYLVREKDYRKVEHAVKRWLQQCRRIIGKRLVIQNNRIVTGYPASKKKQRRLLREAREDHLCE